jgi:hypothetical protein
LRAIATCDVTFFRPLAPLRLSLSPVSISSGRGAISAAMSPMSPYS